MFDARAKREAMDIVLARVAQLERLPSADLDEYGERQDTAITPSGRTLHIVTGVHRGRHGWEPGIVVYAKAFAGSGLRKWFPYTAAGHHADPGAPLAEPLRTKVTVRRVRPGRWR